ncbi:MAG TPA: winged helix-turn-helix transcriptional regulator [Paludibacteraceae bacterium]|nr:winged helix-turn-helix transcriptional regulator [Paludibacteraceae bacterium]
MVYHTVSDDGPIFIEFMLTLIKQALIEMIDSQAKSDQESSQESNQEKISKSNQKILSILSENPQITINGLAEATGLSVSGIKKRLNMLKEAGALQRTGSTKAGYWMVVKK